MAETAGDGLETVLVIDDDKAFCAALAGALRRRGLKAIIAHSHDEALAEAQAWRPSRAVVDLRMPEKSGLEVVAALKRLNPGMAIVVLTGYGSIATAIEAIKLGAVYYLTKPADVEEVLASFTREASSLVKLPEATMPKPLGELEWEHLQQVLMDCQGNISEAARRLGMHRRSLQRKLARGRPQHATTPTDSAS